MKTYTVGVIWQMIGTIDVKADSLEDAIEKAFGDDTALPTNGSYVEGSFDVDEVMYNDYTVK